MKQFFHAVIGLAIGVLIITHPASDLMVQTIVNVFQPSAGAAYTACAPPVGTPSRAARPLPPIPDGYDPGYDGYSFIVPRHDFVPEPPLRI